MNTLHSLCCHLNLITKNELACYSELELIYIMITRLNEVIQSLQAIDANIDESIKNELIQLKESGELESLINESLFASLDEKIKLMGNVPVDNDLQLLLDTVDVVNFPAKTYTITKPLIVRRGKSIKGNHCQIIADFSQWQGNDYTAIKVEIDDGATSPEYVIAHMERVVEDLIIIGKGNNGVISTGIKICNSVSIPSSGAVNHSFSGTMKDVVIRRFDTALNIQSSWQTLYQNIKCLECRRGIVINGKVVNNRFVSCDVTNCSKENTISLGDTYGVVVEPNPSLYTEGDGNPEGNMFWGCTIFQNDYNVYVKTAYFTTFTDCVIDGCQKQSITIYGANELNFNSCYIAQFSKGTGRMVDHSYPNDGVYPSRVSFRDCTLQGMDTDENRGDCFVFNQDGNETFVRFNVVGCSILGFNRVFNFGGYVGVYNSTITGNKCYNIHTSFIGNCVGGMGRTLIDNNRIHDNVPFIELPFIIKDNQIDIGKNSCHGDNATFYEGKITIPHGTSEIILPNNLARTDNGCIYKNTVNFLHSRPQTSYNIVDNYDGSNALIVFNEPTKEECVCVYSVSMNVVD